MECCGDYENGQVMFIAPRRKRKGITRFDEPQLVCNHFMKSGSYGSVFKDKVLEGKL